MRLRLVIALILVLFTCTVLAADDTSAASDKQKFSYAIGFQLAQGMRHDGLNIDIESFNQAVKDVLSDQPPKFSESDMKAAIGKYQQQQAAESAAKAEKSLKEGQAFLTENKAKPGVIARPSGLQYQVLKDGTGKSPKDEDVVEVNYRGTLIDGTEFDSSYSRGKPVTFPVNQVIPGWREVLPLMKEGAHWKVFIPSDLAYGARGAGGDIGPNQTLVFEIELLQVK